MEQNTWIWISVINLSGHEIRPVLYLPKLQILSSGKIKITAALKCKDQHYSFNYCCNYIALLHARHCPKNFANIGSFNLLDNLELRTVTIRVISQMRKPKHIHLFAQSHSEHMPWSQLFNVGCRCSNPPCHHIFERIL